MPVKNVESLLKLTFSISKIFYLMGSILLVDVYTSIVFALDWGRGRIHPNSLKMKKLTMRAVASCDLPLINLIVPVLGEKSVKTF